MVTLYFGGALGSALGIIAIDTGNFIDKGRKFHFDISL